jgi:hypothetical protein
MTSPITNEVFDSASPLLSMGWTPCGDARHRHPEAGQRTMLHPPDGNASVCAPLVPCPPTEWEARGMGGKGRWRAGAPRKRVLATPYSSS